MTTTMTATSLLSNSNSSSKKRPQSTDSGGSSSSKQQTAAASKKSKKRQQQEAREREEEQRLEALLFGGSHKKSTTLLASAEPKLTTHATEAAHDDSDAPLFEIDRAGDAEEDDDDDDDDDDDRSTSHTKSEPTSSTDPSSQRAWVDDDDNDDTQAKVDLLKSSRLRKLRISRDEPMASALPLAELEARLRQRYAETAQVVARTDWANVDDKQPLSASGTNRRNTDDDDDLTNHVLSTSAPLLLHGSSATSSSSLPPNIISLVRCSDANEMEPNRSVVQSVHFHPSSDPDQPLMLTAGLDKMLRFFQVGSDYSEKVHGIQFPKLPIYSASFLGSTGNVVVSGRRPFFYIYDAVAGNVDLVPRILGRHEKSLEKLCVSPDGSMIAFYGNDGYIILVDVRSRQWIADLKMNGSVRAITFNANGEYLYGSGSDGHVYQWDVASRKCMDRFDNQDGTITSSLACSGQHLAVGAESGVVNLFQSQKPKEEGTNSSIFGNRQPIKSIMNIHTSSDLVRFNTDGQILAMSSRRERQVLKLVHVPTRTVFSNWPTTKTPLNYIWSLDFSPQSKFMAIGNDKGKCLLYRLSHYNKE